jgi:phosphoglycerol transferase MdoB-like AlkP superfamily enzyme
MKNREKQEVYISDMSAVKEVLDQLAEGDDPHFIHLVTMQNHAPYPSGHFGEETIDVFGLDNYKTEKTQLTTYVQGTKYTDEAIGYLQEHLADIKRPTIVVVFGDHLPSLYTNTYKKAGWSSKPDLLHQTPLLFLNNMNLGNEDLGAVSPIYLAPMILKMSNMPLNAYYTLLDSLHEQIPDLNFYTMKKERLSKEQTQLLHDYEMIQYDMLIGKQYAKDILFK